LIAGARGTPAISNEHACLLSSCFDDESARR
jgi:hypothetical protein